MLTLEWMYTYLIALFFMFAALSFAFKNNVVFRFVEHTYTGWAVGWAFWLGIERTYSMNIAPIISGERPILIITAFFGVLMFAQFYRKTTWLVRWPTAIMMGTSLAVIVSAGTTSNIIQQLSAVFSLPLTADLTGANTVVFVILTILSLMYFFFSNMGGYSAKTPMKQIIQLGRYVVLFGIGCYFANAFSGDLFKAIGTYSLHLVEGIRRLLA